MSERESKYISGIVEEAILLYLKKDDGRKKNNR